jgi:predicted Zn-dependent protease
MSRGGRTWGWVRKHWLDLMLPPAAFLLAAGMYRQVHTYRTALRYEQATKHYRASMEALKKADRPRALQELSTAARAAPEDPRLQMSLAAGFQALDQRVQAAQLMERALGGMKSPGEGDYLLLVRTWFAAGRYDEAGSVLRREVLRRWPGSAEAAFMDGLIRMYRDKGEPGLQAALPCFERSLQIDPARPDARYHYAVCLAGLGRPAEAEHAFREVLKTSPSFPGASQGLGAALRRQGKEAEARQVLADFQRQDAAQRQIRHLEVQRGLKQATADGLLDLARLYLDLNHPARAKAPLAEYMVLRPTDPRAFRMLAQVYRRTKDRPRADAAMQLAAALGARGDLPR